MTVNFPVTPEKCHRTTSWNAELIHLMAGILFPSRRWWLWKGPVALCGNLNVRQATSQKLFVLRGHEDITGYLGASLRLAPALRKGRRSEYWVGSVHDEKQRTENRALGNTAGGGIQGRKYYSIRHGRSEMTSTTWTSWEHSHKLQFDGLLVRFVYLAFLDMAWQPYHLTFWCLPSMFYWYSSVMLMSYSDFVTLCTLYCALQQTDAACSVSDSELLVVERFHWPALYVRQLSRKRWSRWIKWSPRWPRTQRSVRADRRNWRSRLRWREGTARSSRRHWKHWRSWIWRSSWTSWSTGPERRSREHWW